MGTRKVTSILGGNFLLQVRGSDSVLWKSDVFKPGSVSLVPYETRRQSAQFLSALVLLGNSADERNAVMGPKDLGSRKKEVEIN